MLRTECWLDVTCGDHVKVAMLSNHVLELTLGTEAKTQVWLSKEPTPSSRPGFHQLLFLGSAFEFGGQFSLP